MRKSKIRRLIFSISIIAVVSTGLVGFQLFNNALNKRYEDIEYTHSLIREPSQEVYSEQKGESETVETSVIIKPYSDPSVSESVGYYSNLSSTEDQEKSLIFYENTYMPSTGIMYTSDSEFTVLNTLNGKVKEIKKDNLWGNVVVVEHNNNLLTQYYGLNTIDVNENDEIETGAIIGTTKQNNIFDNKYVLFFETYLDNKIINPQEYYVLNIKN